jgi:hypothetical protein
VLLSLRKRGSYGIEVLPEFAGRETNIGVWRAPHIDENRPQMHVGNRLWVLKFSMNLGTLLVAAGLGALVLAIAAYGFGSAQSGTIAAIVALSATAAGLAVINERRGPQHEPMDTVAVGRPGS